MELNKGEIGLKMGKNRRNITQEKKYHTVKYLCIANKKLHILYTSCHYPGRIHDKTMFEEESKIERLSEEIKKLFDLAFYGIEKDYKNVVMPNKKPKGKNLTEKQKSKNKQISRIRVRIENSFAGVKRLRITSFTILKLNRIAKKAG